MSQESQGSLVSEDSQNLQIFQDSRDTQISQLSLGYQTSQGPQESQLCVTYISPKALKLSNTLYLAMLDTYERTHIYFWRLEFH